VLIAHPQSAPSTSGAGQDRGVQGYFYSSCPDDDNAWGIGFVSNGGAFGLP